MSLTDQGEVGVPGYNCTVLGFIVVTKAAHCSKCRDPSLRNPLRDYNPEAPKVGMLRSERGVDGDDGAQGRVLSHQPLGEDQPARSVMQSDRLRFVFLPPGDGGNRSLN